MLIIEANVCISCTNDDNENKYGHVLYCQLDTIACSSTVRSGMRLVDQGSYTDGKGPASRFIIWASAQLCQASNAHLWR